MTAEPKVTSFFSSTNTRTLHLPSRKTADLLQTFSRPALALCDSPTHRTTTTIIYWSWSPWAKHLTHLTSSICDTGVWKWLNSFRLPQGSCGNKAVNHHQCVSVERVNSPFPLQGLFSIYLEIWKSTFFNSRASGGIQHFELSSLTPQVGKPHRMALCYCNPLMF